MHIHGIVQNQAIQSDCESLVERGNDPVSGEIDEAKKVSEPPVNNSEAGQIPSGGDQQDSSSRSATASTSGHGTTCSGSENKGKERRKGRDKYRNYDSSGDSSSDDDNYTDHSDPASSSSSYGSN